jgi:hypothetical protein
MIRLIRKIIGYLNQSPPLLMALLGIAVSAAMAIPIAMVGVGLASRYLASDYFFSQEDVIRIAWVGVVGAQGAAVSLIIRRAGLVKDEQPPALHFLNGLLKPFVGMSFAHLSYMIFASGLIAKPAVEKRDIYFYVSVAFVAGFSERFARDLMSRIPGGGPESDTQSK